MDRLKKEALAYQPFKKRRWDTLLAWTVIIGVGQGLGASLSELSRLLTGIRVGVGCLITLILMIWVLVLRLAAHDHLQQRGDGKSYLVILIGLLSTGMCSTASLG